jgi:hypothetical protein
MSCVVEENAVPPVPTSSIRSDSAPRESFKVQELPDVPQHSLRRTIAIFVTLTGITTTSSMTTGLLAVALPRMAEDLNLSNSLLLW